MPKKFFQWHEMMPKIYCQTIYNWIFMHYFYSIYSLRLIIICFYSYEKPLNLK
jgi:hypothetical protein